MISILLLKNLTAVFDYSLQFIEKPILARTLRRLAFIHENPSLVFSLGAISLVALSGGYWGAVGEYFWMGGKFWVAHIAQRFF